ncbi:hypothetical protein [Parashewanella curva]|uniref:hypothetical protein n=1 Tax=Parashewanella curva TaxID=2338552 RepID=UPI00105A5C6D|nr:hypothetical protein [Parashewanella curva]
MPFYHLRSSGFWHLKVKPENSTEFERLTSISNARVRNLVDFAYLDDELFDYLQSSTTAPILRHALTANLDTLEQQYARWAIKLGKSEKTVKNYLGALKSSIPSWLNGSGSDSGYVYQSLLSVSNYFGI